MRYRYSEEKNQPSQLAKRLLFEVSMATMQPNWIQSHRLLLLLCVCILKSTKSMRTNYECVCVCLVKTENKNRPSVGGSAISSSIVFLFVYCYINIGELLPQVCFSDFHVTTRTASRRCHCHWSGTILQTKRTSLDRHANKQKSNERRDKEDERRPNREDKNWQSRKTTTIARIEMPNKILTFSRQKRRTTITMHTDRIGSDGWVDGARWSCFCLVHACMCAPYVASIRNSKIYYVFFGFLAKQQQRQRQPNKSSFANERGLGRSGQKKKNKKKKRKRNSIWLWNCLRLTVHDDQPLLVADVARTDRSRWRRRG